MSVPNECRDAPLAATIELKGRHRPVNPAIRLDRGEEEWANGLSHAVGCALSLVGSVILMRHAIAQGIGWQVISCSIYCGSLVSVYAASTLSHWARSPRWKDCFRCWDQGLIYLLIAGTYTPIAVAFSNDGRLHWITVLMWTLAIAGFVSKVVLRHRVNGIALWLYLALGWLPIIGLPYLLDVAPFPVVFLVVGGGFAYTLGSVLLANDHKVPYLHVGWHVMVMLGSLLHYLAVWQYVVVMA